LIKVTISVSLVFTLLVGCNSSTSSSPELLDDGQEPNSDSNTANPSDGVLNLGLITIEERLQSSVVDVSGKFIGFAEAVTEAEVNRYYQYSGQEQCFVNESEAFGSTNGLLLREHDDVSAGDFILLSSLSGTYGELLADFESGANAEPYRAASELPFPAPDPMLIDIAGATFPEFGILEIAAVPVLDDENLTIGSVLSADTDLTWNVESNGVGGITLEAFAPLGNGSVARVVCSVTDDGAFTLPASTVTELDSALGSSEWSLEIEELERFSQIVQQTGSTLLIVKRQITDNF